MTDYAGSKGMLPRYSLVGCVIDSLVKARLRTVPPNIVVVTELEHIVATMVVAGTNRYRYPLAYKIGQKCENANLGPLTDTY